MTLAALWFVIISCELALYILLDGADLGIGMLSLLPQKEERRALLMHIIGPIWDANETWLVIAGGTLFGAFPLAYGVILNALYIPVMIALFGLILRVAAYEFHEYATAHQHFFALAFGFGSLLAVVGQGLVASGLASGIAVAGGAFAGGAFDWLTPLTSLVTLGFIAVYVVLGYAYLLNKSEGGVREERTHHYLYYAALAVVALVFAGIVAHGYPYLIPPAITVGEAAASPSTLVFMLWGFGPLLPIVLAYNFYLYHVFRDERAGGRSEHYG